MEKQHDPASHTDGGATPERMRLWQLADALARAARCDGMDAVFLPGYLRNCYGAPDPDVAADVTARMPDALNSALVEQGLPAVRFDGRSYRFGPPHVT